MAASQSSQTPEVDLGSLDFWGRPAEERDRYFAELRREAPISRHQPPEDILGLPDQGRTGLLGDRALRGHAPDLARPRDVLLGPGRAVRRRAAGVPRGVAVVPGDGRAAAHEAARPRLLRLHAAPGGAHRGRDPDQRAADRRRGGADRRRRLRRADRQAAAAGDDLGHDRRAGGRPRARRGGRRPARHGVRPRGVRRPARRSRCSARRCGR